jgi:FKBP-type peptidyl-prolyl cis-trans isomerase FkpA
MKIKKYKMKSYLYLMLSILVFTSCDKEANFEPQTEADIIAYIAANNLNATRTSYVLYYVIDNSCSGARPTSTSNVTVAYKGYFLDGNTFDQSGDAGISFGLNQVIPGWTEGIPLFKEGGEGMLLIPYNLGYGANTRNGIPGGSVLLFDIKLIRVN